VGLVGGCPAAPTRLEEVEGGEGLHAQLGGQALQRLERGIKLGKGDVGVLRSHGSVQR